MASLVADYGSDSESSFDSGSAEVNAEKSESVTLPKPDFEVGSCDGHSVFVNPFVAADNEKIAILEKHVKMISTDVKTVNGRKICWNYRKNKCRFGHNCKYAHDSDIQVEPAKGHSESNEDIKVRKSVPVALKQQRSLYRSKKRPSSKEVLVSSEKIMKTTNKANVQDKNL